MSMVTTSGVSSIVKLPAAALELAVGTAIVLVHMAMATRLDGARRHLDATRRRAPPAE